MAAPLLHTPGEAAVLLRCTESWLKDKARLREIPFTLVGGSYHFTDEHLEWIIRHFEQTPEQQPGQLKAAAPRRRTAPAAVVTADVPQLQARRPRRFAAS